MKSLCVQSPLSCFSIGPSQELQHSDSTETAYSRLSHGSMALAQQKLDRGSLESTVHLQEEPYPSVSTSSSAVAVPEVQLDTSVMEEVDYESLPTTRLSVHLCAGAAAGIMEHCAMYPVDCVKVGNCMQCS